jgi:hypothetical protein
VRPPLQTHRQTSELRFRRSETGSLDSAAHECPPALAAGCETRGGAIRHAGSVNRSTPDVPSRWLIALVIVVIGVYVWVAAALHPFTLGEEIMVAVPALIVFVGACWPIRRTGTGDTARASRVSVAVWLLLVGLFVGWELFAYFSSPRDQHPTLSIIADEIMSVHAGRALLFLAWLALGWVLITRRRAAPQ